MYHKAVSRLRTFGCALRDFAPIALLAIALGLAAGPALAELPTVSAPDGAESGDYLGMSGAFIKKALLLAGLVIAAAGFTVVAGGAIGKFNEYRISKAELGAVFTYSITGALILIIIVYLLTEAAAVM